MVRGLLLLVAFALGSAARADTLPPPVANALARASIPQSAVGLFVQEVDSTKPALTFNASQPLNPASTF